MKSLLVGVSLFLFSLSGFSKISGLLSIVIIVVFLLLDVEKLKIRVGLVISLLVMITYVILVSTFTDNIVIYLLYYHFYVVYILLFSMLLARFRSSDIVLIVDQYLLIHLASFYIQMITYYSSGYYVDFYSVVPGSSAHSAYIARELSGTWVALRPTGFFTEPSFFAMAIFPGVMYKVITGKYNSKVLIASILAILFTFSIAAIVVMVAFLGILTIKKSLSRGGLLPLFGMSLLLAIFIYISYDFMYARVFESETPGYDPIYYRLAILYEFSMRPLLDNLVGVGYFFDEFSATNGVTGLTAAGVRDSGFWASLFYSGGVLGVILFFLFLYVLFNYEFRYLPLIFVILFMKYSVINASFWVLILLCYVAVNGVNKKSLNGISNG
jgi:hypothetical protein